MTERQLNIRPEVMRFAEAMERKLRENHWKGGWQDMSPGDILLRVREELKELTDCDDDFKLLGEAADVANYLMMLCDVKGMLPRNRRVDDLPRYHSESTEMIARRQRMR